MSNFTAFTAPAIKAFRAGLASDDSAVRYETITDIFRVDTPSDARWFLLCKAAHTAIADGESRAKFGKRIGRSDATVSGLILGWELAALTVESGDPTDKSVALGKRITGELRSQIPTLKARLESADVADRAAMLEEWAGNLAAMKRELSTGKGNGKSTTKAPAPKATPVVETKVQDGSVDGILDSVQSLLNGLNKRAAAGALTPAELARVAEFAEAFGAVADRGATVAADRAASKVSA